MAISLSNAKECSSLRSKNTEKGRECFFTSAHKNLTGLRNANEKQIRFGHYRGEFKTKSARNLVAVPTGGQKSYDEYSKLTYDAVSRFNISSRW